MAYNFSQKAKDATSLSELMNGKTKVDTTDIIKKYPDGITVTAADIVDYTKDGKEITYPVVQFAENENAFYMGGTIILQIVEAWLKDFDGVVADMNAALKESGGCKMKLTEGKSKSGNRMTKVEIL